MSQNQVNITDQLFHMRSLHGQHLASTLVAIVVGLLIIKVVRNLIQGKREGHVDGGSRAAFFSGVLLVNALAHFSHGISSVAFPAPFGYLVGPGLLSNLFNVIWGFINIVLGYFLLVQGKVFGGDKRRVFVFFVGVLVMGVFLSVVFSH